VPDALVRWADENTGDLKANLAAAAFSRLGPDAQPAIPVLVKMMNDSARFHDACRATWILARIGEAALPHLLANLADTNAMTRRLTATLLGQVSTLKTNANSAVPLLVQCLQDKDHGLRYRAAETLGRLALHPELVVPALTNCLDESASRPLRVSAIRSLGQYGKQAIPAMPVVLSALADPDGLVRETATNALRQIVPAAPASGAP
jgi:HEAT repeat protein